MGSSTSPPDPARRNEHSRRAVIDAAVAVAVISELGHDQTSIEEIARRPGVGELRHHVKGVTRR